MISTVIFDLDDTLYDEIDYCRSGFQATARFLKHSMKLPEWVTEDAIFRNLLHHFNEGNRTRTFNATLDDMNIEYTDEVIFSLIKLYREHEPTLQLPEDSRKVLDELQGQYHLALLSDGFLPAQELKLKALGIVDLFKEVLFTENLGRSYWKPHKKGFEMLLNKLNQPAAQCVYVGDNAEKDFIAPNELGMQTIQLIRPNRMHDQPPADRRASPGQIIGSILQLPTALKRL
jgi:putative hydrolase of the HAD superfamily